MIIVSPTLDKTVQTCTLSSLEEGHVEISLGQLRRGQLCWATE